MRNAKANDKALDARVTELARQNNGIMVSAKVNDPSGPKLHTLAMKKVSDLTMNPPAGQPAPKAKTAPKKQTAKNSGTTTPKKPVQVIIQQSPRSNAGGNLSKKTNMDKTVMPLLLKAMSECAKQKPAQPIEFIANYLAENNPDKRN